MDSKTWWYPKLRNEKWLREQYIDNLRTLQDIAEEVGCDKSAVGRALKRQGIERRKRTSKYELLNDKEWLTRVYVDEEWSIYDIAKKVGCAHGNVHSALTSLGIRIRGPKESHKIAFPEGMCGDNHPNWKGGRRIVNGYVFVYAPDHPYTNNNIIQEHRLIMEEHIGRYLEPYEVVHHKNSIKDDNRIENLELKERGRHISEHFKASHEVLEMRQEIEKLRKENEELRQRINELEEKID